MPPLWHWWEGPQPEILGTPRAQHPAKEPPKVRSQMGFLGPMVMCPTSEPASWRMDFHNGNPTFPRWAAYTCSSKGFGSVTEDPAVSETGTVPERPLQALPTTRVLREDLGSWWGIQHLPGQDLQLATSYPSPATGNLRAGERAYSRAASTPPERTGPLPPCGERQIAEPGLSQLMFGDLWKEDHPQGGMGLTSGKPGMV